jgi:carboxypeptidase family protein
MRKYVLRGFVACLCIASWCAVAQRVSPTTGVLRGQVVDSSEHARISRAFVLLHTSGSVDRTVKVDDQGRFSIELPAGVYDVFVSSRGFDPACRKIEVQFGKTLVYNVQLKANTIGMED